MNEGGRNTVTEQRTIESERDNERVNGRELVRMAIFCDENIGMVRLINSPAQDSYMWRVNHLSLVIVKSLESSY